MAYIYCIVNNINGKKYIGKTNTTIEERFTTHVRDSSRETCKHRALYRAFNKYGVQNFSIHKLEECKWDEASDREIYYIDLYDTFRNGYNETLGGDGSTRIDYDNVVEVYFKYCSIHIAANKLGIHRTTVNKILLGMGIKPATYYKTSRPVICIDLSNNKQYIFESVIGASKRIYNIKNGRTKFSYNRKEHNDVAGIATHIRRAIKTGGTSYGCMWLKSSIEEASRYLKYIQIELKEPNRISIDNSFITIDITGLQNIRFNNT